MVDDTDLEGLDPYDLMQAEANRLDQFFTGLDDDAWSRPSRCEGWSVRDVLAHLLASEQYNSASLEGTVGDFLASVGARGAIDLASANELGIRELDDQSTAQIIEKWRTENTRVREGLRGRDGGDVDTSVGAYPARWQAFHLAFELAVHADDVGVPVTASEEAARTAWQAQFARFALKELDKDLEIKAANGSTQVRGSGIDVELSDAVFVQAAAARLDDTGPLDAEQRALLSVTP
jgi:uncharacterized protein (TIGR03083 family)